MIRFEQYLEVNGLSPQTIALYGMYLKRFEKEYEELSQDSINLFMLHNQNIVARAFVRKLIEYYRQQYPEHINELGALQIPIPHYKEAKKIEPLTREEVETLMEHTDLRLRTMIGVCFYTGMRSAGVLSLSRNSVTLALTKWVTSGGYEQGEVCPITIPLKGRRTGEVYLPHRIAVLLDNYMENDERSNRNNKNIWGIKKRRFALLLEQVGMRVLGKRVHPHQLRHSFGTHLVKEGTHLMSVKELMHHRSVQSTEIYVHMDKSKLRSDVSKVFK